MIENLGGSGGSGQKYKTQECRSESKVGEGSIHMDKNVQKKCTDRHVTYVNTCINHFSTKPPCIFKYRFAKKSMQKTIEKFFKNLLFTQKMFLLLCWKYPLPPIS